uniref:Uncharacterized protein n=1 Tax=Anguilla anguilla TaxID=7936 RepID=A0A0E9UQ71_ANGAN
MLARVARQLGICKLAD